MNRMIVTAIDDNPHYMEGLKVFLFSAKKNIPKEWFYIYLMNCSSEYVNELYSINPNIIAEKTITNETNPFVRNYVRYGILLKLIKEYNDTHKFAWLDNDIIIRKDLEGLWDDIKPETLKIWYRKHYHKNLKKRKRPEVFFQGGVFVVGNGKPIKKWLSNIIHNVKDKTDWYATQAQMYLCWKSNKKIDFVQLNTIYNDTVFDDNSYIWHCRQSGFDNEKYQKEYREYLNELCL